MSWGWRAVVVDDLVKWDEVFGRFDVEREGRKCGLERIQ